MPLYMDIHNLDDGTTAEDVAKAHELGESGRVSGKLVLTV